MSEKRVNLSIVIPTYNEAENIPRIIQEIEKVLKEISHEIVIVDDNSPDGTYEVVRRLSLPNLRAILRENEKGLASAVIRGINEALTDTVVVMDADLQHPPSLIPLLYRAIAEEGIDVAIASRYVKGGRIEGWKKLRKFWSRVANIIAKFMFPLKLKGIKDITSGYFALRRDRISSKDLSPLGFKILLEILVKHPHVAKKELPYTFSPRRAGSSKMNFKTMLEYLLHLLRLWLGR